MKKTFLISLFLLFTSSVFAVSIPGGGLGTEGNSFDTYYSDGIGLRSLDQIGESIFQDPGSPDPSEQWKGTWSYISGDVSAETAMEMTPAEYVEANCTDNKISFTKVNEANLLSSVQNECMAKGAKREPCYNYAVDVYNLALTSGYFDYGIGDDARFKGYLQAPVSTDVLFMALLAAAYVAFAAWQKKSHLVAKF